MWHNEYLPRFVITHETQTGFRIITFKHDPGFTVPKGLERYETLVFPLKRDGDINIDKCLSSVFSSSEDKAYLCHMKTWEFYNRGKND